MPSPDPRLAAVLRPAGIVRVALVALSYLAVFGAWTWPLLAHPASWFPAEPGADGYMQLWNVWYFSHAVANGNNPFFSDWLLYPTGSWLWMHTYTPIIGLVNTLINNNMLALNLSLAAEYALSGVGGWWLARRWVRQPLLAWGVGFVFAFSPYKMLRLSSHYDLVLTATVPFYIAAFLRALAFRPGWHWPVVRSWWGVALCAGLGLLTLLSDYYITFGLIYFSGAYALYFWLNVGAINWQRPRTWLLLAAGLVLSHVAIRLLRIVNVPDNGGFWWGGDVLGYLVPPPNSRWLAFGWASRFYHNPHVFNMPGSIENVMFLGYTLPLLALGLAIGHWRRPTAAAPTTRPPAVLGALLLFFALLTLPAIRIFGQVRWNLPTGALHMVPFFNNIRCPTRWVLLVSLLGSLLVFAALARHWHAARTPPAWRWGLSAALLAVIATEYWPVPPPLVVASQMPAAFRAVAALPGEALFPVPVGLVDGRNGVGKVDLQLFLYQPYYRKKLPSAYISRISPAGFAAFTADPVLRTVLRLQRAPSDTLVPTPTAAAAATFRRTYRPAAVLVLPAWRNGPAHRYLRAVFPDFKEQVFADGYVLLRPRE